MNYGPKKNNKIRLRKKYYTGDTMCVLLSFVMISQKLIYWGFFFGCFDIGENYFFAKIFLKK